jgi:hypothetical protein
MRRFADPVTSLCAYCDGNVERLGLVRERAYQTQSSRVRFEIRLLPKDRSGAERDANMFGLSSRQAQEPLALGEAMESHVRVDTRFASEAHSSVRSSERVAIRSDFGRQWNERCFGWNNTADGEFQSGCLGSESCEDHAARGGYCGKGKKMPLGVRKRVLLDVKVVAAMRV